MSEFRPILTFQISSTKSKHWIITSIQKFKNFTIFLDFTTIDIEMFRLNISKYTQTYRRYSSKIHVNNDYRELSAANIRNTFIDYFVKEHKHRFIRSSPVTPFCDPTVPFVNAGMNQV